MNNTKYTTATMERGTLKRLHDLDKYGIGMNKTISYLLDLHDEMKFDDNIGHPFGV